MVGLAVGVVENGEIRFLKGYGVTQAGGSEPVTPSTVFRWASLSKGVAADMVVRLAADGSLSLDDPIARYASSVRLPGGNENVATVANLLSHTTGLFAHAEDPRLEDGMDPHILRASMALLHNTCSPGTCHAYQNVALRRGVRDRRAGHRQALWPGAARALFRTAGHDARRAPRRADLMASRSWARGHVGGNPQTFEISEAYYRVPAAGGVNGSIQDLSIWMLANMGLAPDVLTPAMLQQVQTPRISTPGREPAPRAGSASAPPGPAYGLGWRIMDYAGHQVIGHHGGVKGYRSMIMFDPALKSGVVVLWNSASSRPNGIEYEVMDMVYQLPFRDWLSLDSREERAAEPEQRAMRRNRANGARRARSAGPAAGRVARASAPAARGRPRSANDPRRGASSRSGGRRCRPPSRSRLTMIRSSEAIGRRAWKLRPQGAKS